MHYRILKMKVLFFTTFFAASSFLATSAFAGTYDLQSTQSASIASGVYGGYFDYGTATLGTLETTHMLVNWSQATDEQALIQFDLGSLPVGQTILSATLFAYHDINNGNGVTLTALQNSSSWDGNTVTYDTKPSVSGTTGSLTVADSLTGLYRSIDVTSAAIAWYASPASNDGLTIAESSGGTMYLVGGLPQASASDPAQRPYLEINTAPVPEPSSLAIFGLGLS